MQDLDSGYCLFADARRFQNELLIRFGYRVRICGVRVYDGDNGRYSFTGTDRTKRCDALSRALPQDAIVGLSRRTGRHRHQSFAALLVDRVFWQRDLLLSSFVIHPCHRICKPRSSEPCGVMGAGLNELRAGVQIRPLASFAKFALRIASGKDPAAPPR